MASRSPVAFRTTAGPGSNYDTHALAAMAEALRRDPGALGLISGIGMHMTSHSAVVLSTTPGPFPPAGPAPALDQPTVPVTTDAVGAARVVTFSTVYSREGPQWTALICDLPDGSRCYARLEEAPDDETDLAGEQVTLAPGPRGATLARL